MFERFKRQPAPKPQEPPAYPQDAYTPDERRSNEAVLAEIFRQAPLIKTSSTLGVARDKALAELDGYKQHSHVHIGYTMPYTLAKDFSAAEGSGNRMKIKQKQLKQVIATIQADGSSSRYFTIPLEIRVRADSAENIKKCLGMVIAKKPELHVYNADENYTGDRTIGSDGYQKLIYAVTQRELDDLQTIVTRNPSRLDASDDRIKPIQTVVMNPYSRDEFRWEHPRVRAANVRQDEMYEAKTQGLNGQQRSLLWNAYQAASAIMENTNIGEETRQADALKILEDTYMLLEKSRRGPMPDMRRPRPSGGNDEPRR